MPKRIEWTEQRKAQLKALLAEGQSYREAARKMGMRRDQARSAAAAYGLAPARPPRKYRDWSRQEYDTLEQLLTEGLTYPQIAARMGLEINEVKGASQRLGLMDPDRVGKHRRRDDWHEIDRILADCIEARLMTLPQAHRYLDATGYQVALTTLYDRLEKQDPPLRRRAESNGVLRKRAVGQRVMKARAARQRQQQQQKGKSA